MANISAFAGKLMLDFMFKGAAATQPAGVFFAPTLGPPTSVSSSWMPSGSGITASSLIMPAASTPGTVVNTAAVTFGPLSGASNSFSGVAITDSVSSAAGNLLWFGNLATVRSLIIGDSLVFAASSITASLV
jgi:hypothetical protein